MYRQGALVCRSAILLAAQPVPAQVKLLGLPLGLDDGAGPRARRGRGRRAAGGAGPRIALDLAVPDPALPPPRRRRAQAKARCWDPARWPTAAPPSGPAGSRSSGCRCYERPANKRGQPIPAVADERDGLALIEFRQQPDGGARRAAAPQLCGEQRQAEERREHLEARRKAASKARQAKPHELRKAALISLRASPRCRRCRCALIFEYMVPRLAGPRPTR